MHNLLRLNIAKMDFMESKAELKGCWLLFYCIALYCTLNHCFIKLCFDVLSVYFLFIFQHNGMYKLKLQLCAFLIDINCWQVLVSG